MKIDDIKVVRTLEVTLGEGGARIGVEVDPQHSGKLLMRFVDFGEGPETYLVIRNLNPLDVAHLAAGALIIEHRNQTGGRDD